ESLQQFAFDQEILSSALRSGIFAECVQCGIRVTGEELLELSEPAKAPAHNPRVERLRQGYCARNSCDTYFYRLLFPAHPDIDWATVLARTESVAAERVQQVEAGDAMNEAAKRAARWRLVARVGIGLAAVALLLLVRQWYLGGRIPLIREPENFQVDHFPSGQQPPQ